MDKFHIAKITLAALLLLIIPLLSTSMRPPYLYLIANLLTIAIGAESGLLTALSNGPDDKKPVAIATVSTVSTMEVPNDKRSGSVFDGHDRSMTIVEKPAIENDTAVVKVRKVVRKCPSTPSLFFIGGCEVEENAIEEDEEEKEGLSGPELFNKAETFIGNFYKQLKMQREESWKKIHGLFTKGPSEPAY